MFEWSASPLIPQVQGVSSSHLAVTYRDVEVSEPHLLTLSLVNVGPADVASSHFDGGRDLTIRLGCTMYGLLHPPASPETLTTVTTAMGSEGAIYLQPGLLRRGGEWMVDVVVGGIPSPELDSPLIDTDVVDPPTYRSQLASNLALRLAQTVLNLMPGGGLAAAALDLVVSKNERPRGGTLGNG